MSESAPCNAEYPGTTVDSASNQLWAEARNVMLTDNSMLAPQDPLRCMDLQVSSWQIENVQRCIKTLYQGLKWADLLKIRGGFTGQRSYGKLFLINDPYITGVFDNRNTSSDGESTDYHPPENLKELIQLYNKGQSNIKTLVVFEKPNLRLANSDEKARQSYFVAETIYPALAAIIQVRTQIKKLPILGGSTVESKVDNDKVQLVKIFDKDNQDSPQLSRWFIKLFKDPKHVNQELLEQSPLQIFCSPNSPLNLDIDDNFLVEELLVNLGRAQ
ncbi:MAG: hypothetical protein KTR27_20995 [Leptolyngbyaceae cyanobacterium MAG.088]|nr:hypothetical protein [Leptolyngbyaceae cyanobacterium MAG.088]